MALLLASGIPGLAKDSRTVALSRDAILRGTSLPAGQYVVRWEVHTPRASVEFERGHKVVLSTEGRVEDRGKKYHSNMVVYDTASDGTMTIIEIRFAGSSEVLVFERANLKITLRMHNYGISRPHLDRSEARVTESQLLGRAMAHQIGHLLLGPNSHTAVRVMRAQWHRQDLQTIARAQLFFTDQQSRRVRDEASVRNTIQQDELTRAKK